MEKETTMEEVFGEVISSYSRQQAIEDGVLITDRFLTHVPDGSSTH